PLLVVVCVVGGTIAATRPHIIPQATTTYDGTYSGSYSGNIVCVAPDGTIITQPVDRGQLTPWFTLKNGVVVAPSGWTGSVDSFGHLNMTATPPGFANPVTFTGTIGFTGNASGSWSVGGLPPGCTGSGGWSAER